MKKNNLFKSIGALLLCATFISCSEESIDPNQITENTQNKLGISFFEVKNGKLHFEDKASLQTFLENDYSFVKQAISQVNVSDFRTLKPTIEILKERNLNTEEYLSQKYALNKKNSLKSLNTDDEDLDMDDELIADDNFASILNEDREIYIGDSLYIYTTNGLYFTSIEKEEILHNYLDSLKDNLTTSSIKQSIRKRTISTNLSMKRVEQNNSLSIRPIEGRVEPVNNDINRFVPTYIQPGAGSGGGGYSGGGGSNSGGSGSGSDDYPILKPLDFGHCDYDPGSLWQQAFGERVKCKDYHDSKHRINTIFYNENYYVYAAIGAKAKYQKKRLIGWSKSGTADEVVLGINHLKFTYDFNLPSYNPLDEEYLTYQYKGVTYSALTHNVVNYNIAGPSNWPIPNNDEALITLRININSFLGNIDKEYIFDGKKANSAIKGLIKEAANTIPGLVNDLENNKVQVEIIKYSENSVEMVWNNKVITAKEMAEKKFDLNFLFEYNSDNSYDNLNDWLEQLNAKPYKNVEVEIYGAALRNGVWKGKRIIGHD